MDDLETPHNLGSDPRLRVRYSRDNASARVAGMLLGALLPIALLIGLALYESKVLNAAGAVAILLLAVVAFAFGYLRLRRRRAARQVNRRPPS